MFQRIKASQERCGPTVAFYHLGAADICDTLRGEVQVIRQIKTVGVYVVDQPKAVEFYTKTLGFEIRRTEPMGQGGQWIEVAPPGAQTSVVLYPRSMMPKWEHLKPSVVFACEDAEVTCRDLAAKGVQITGQPRRMAWGTFAKFVDLDGNEFVLASA
jgi:predicted enzyme related to lactoylglutathione lyase